MGKRKIFNNEGDDDVNAEKVEMDEESSSSHIDAGCWSKQKLKHKRGNRVICPGIDTLSYKHAKRLMKRNENCGLVEIVDQQHITIGWHQCGNANEAVHQILTRIIGRYYPRLNGIPLAIGKISFPEENHKILADQPCLHIDVCLKIIIFRPVLGKTYDCVVTSISDTIVAANIFNAITFTAHLMNGKKKPNIGDIISIRYVSSNFKGSLCQMKGELL